MVITQSLPGPGQNGDAINTTVVRWNMGSVEAHIHVGGSVRYEPRLVVAQGIPDLVSRDAGQT